MNQQADPKTKRAALIVATLSSFIGPFMSSSVNVALPSISDAFSMGAVSLGWVNTAFLLASSVFVIPFGRLGDIYGRKKIYLWGVVVYTASSVLIANAQSGEMIILYRVFQGFGSSMILATGMPILISAYPAGERGKALGIAVSAVYLGLSLGPFIGGIITEQLGWRFIFWFNLPLGLLLVAVIFFMLKQEWAEAEGEQLDIVGSLILAGSLFTAMYGISSLPGILPGGLAALGLVGLIVFVLYESRIDNPVIDIKLFRYNTVFAFSNLAAMINYAATFAVSFLLSLYLQNLKALSPQQAGFVLVAQPLIQAIFSPLAGRLSDKWEPRIIASIGMGLNFVGLLLLVFLTQETSVMYVLFCLVFLGFGFALFSSPNTNAIMSSVERRNFGVAGAMVSMMRQVGMMFSMGIVMMLLALTLGQAEIAPENYGQFARMMRIAFILFAVLLFGGIFASLARGKMQRGEG